MINILGSESMESTLEPCARALGIPGATVHLYGKKECRKGRKMGHITVVGESVEEVLRDVDTILGTTTDQPLTKPYPLVSIIMGSDSDLPTMKPAAQVLTKFNIPFEITIVSAHRTPLRMVQFAQEADKRGIKVIMAGAGGAAHLPGMVAALTPLPVIGVPVKGSVLDGQDSLLSIVQMPRGIPVATVAIGNSTNAALLAVRILGVAVPGLVEGMKEFMRGQEEEVLGKVGRMEREGWEGYGV